MDLNIHKSDGCDRWLFPAKNLMMNREGCDFKVVADITVVCSREECLVIVRVS